MSTCDDLETEADRVCPALTGSALRPYYASINRGRQVARESKLAICALARSVAMTLTRAEAQVNDLADQFGTSHLFICENDSSDSTRSDLQTWKPRTDSYWLLGQTWEDPIWPRARDMARAERMAYYRQLCHDAVMARAADADYVLVLDFDLSSVSTRGVLHTLGQPKWDAVGSNGLARVRTKWVQFDAWALRDFGSDRPLSWRDVHPRVLAPGRPMLPVNSAFGGLAVYRMAAFKQGRYAGGDCEHVTMHRSLREAGHGKIYVNPSQVVIY